MPSLTWASYSAPIVSGGYFGYAPGSEVSRERSVAAAVTADMLTSDPTIASLVEQFAVYSIGNGLTLSSRPDHTALGITPETARELAGKIERAWLSWSANPVECDAAGRHTLPQLITAAFKSWLVTGEIVAVLNTLPVSGARTRTKLSLLDSRQLDQSITRTGDNGASILNGVQFDGNGRVQGYWIRRPVLGSINSAPQALYVASRTSWGRPLAVHIFDYLMPGQVRGVSPLIASLTSARAKAILTEYGLAAALIGTMLAATVESDLPNAAALGGVNTGEALGAFNGASIADIVKTRGEFYSGAPKISMSPGTVAHLHPGDSLKLTKSEAPNGTFEAFNAALSRTAAKSAGSSAEDLSGDFSKTSFSASRLANELPWRINLRRRSAIAEPLYRAVFVAWLEEMFETQRIELPTGAPTFLEAAEAYSASLWRGSAKPVADVYKQTQSDVLRLEHGLATYSEILGENGKDFESHLVDRASEKKQIEAAGFVYPTPKAVLAYEVANAVAEESDKDQ
ncbi:phage portal protein [Bradyrhizobium sp.]|uniref:phage portal protein n=1 Tax=Bradyrhizobium sp. TaxID=376 RepID=UPI0025B86595|nr:phage portal protein [Bradyrhizobium sp.]